MDSTQRMDYLYKEYTRLNEKVEEHIKHSYEDFKFLGAIGAVVVLWKPIADLIALANPQMNYSNLLFLGFLSLLLTVAIIGFMNLVKQSYVLFCVSNLQGFEKEIRKILNEAGDAQIFCLNLEKETKFIKTFRLTFGAFAAISALAVTCVPFVVLLNSNATHAVIYLLMAIMVFLSYFKVFRRMVKQYFNKAKLL
ncbi:hypothetical protein VB780_18605 [Leptolyngbya sp. CCNP1308]|uniref:hypothetical protein n=1 Tax=Leptolyngbya sp. CCNP1308 TaxID=3110255 RepID=UPI002B200B30|nr:hypothetical protein [Leptolyngbya sp. CCNP1308]MEA5450597.1 hypothetical protein [Leptolyngbya sp. CCNP1308]